MRDLSLGANLGGVATCDARLSLGRSVGVALRKYVPAVGQWDGRVPTPTDVRSPH